MLPHYSTPFRLSLSLFNLSCCNHSIALDDPEKKNGPVCLFVERVRKNCAAKTETVFKQKGKKRLYLRLAAAAVKVMPMRRVATLFPPVQEELAA